MARTGLTQRQRAVPKRAASTNSRPSSLTPLPDELRSDNDSSTGREKSQPADNDLQDEEPVNDKEPESEEQDGENEQDGESEQEKIEVAGKRKPGRPSKYHTAAEKSAARAARNARYRDKDPERNRKQGRESQRK